MVKEDDQTLNLKFFFLSFIFFIPMSQIIIVINRNDMCYCGGGCAGVYMCNYTHETGPEEKKLL